MCVDHPYRAALRQRAADTVFFVAPNVAEERRIIGRPAGKVGFGNIPYFDGLVKGAGDNFVTQVVRPVDAVYFGVVSADAGYRKGPFLGAWMRIKQERVKMGAGKTHSTVPDVDFVGMRGR